MRIYAKNADRSSYCRRYATDLSQRWGISDYEYLWFPFRESGDIILCQYSGERCHDVDIGACRSTKKNAHLQTFPKKNVRARAFCWFLTKNDRRNANKSRVNLLSICFCVALALVSHSFRDKRKWQIEFTTEACSGYWVSNYFHATITGWRSQLTFGFEKGRQSGRLSRPRTPENTLSKAAQSNHLV